MGLKRRACLNDQTRGAAGRPARYFALGSCLTAFLLLTPFVAGQHDHDTLGVLEPRIKTSEPIFFEHVATARVTVPDGGASDGVRSAQGTGQTCPFDSTYTDADFDGPGPFSILSGFAELEIAAASYTIDPGFFPILIEKVEMVFAHHSSNNADTTTHWTLLIGPGTPANMSNVVSSNGLDIPYLEIPAGENAVNLVVDLETPFEITEQQASDHNFIFSVGFRIDVHNDPSDNPCLADPPADSNAFPTVDTSGVSDAANNWMRVLNCGPFDCPAGWRRFEDLAFCEPDGDWVLRATWSPVTCPDQGACCLPNGNGTCDDDKGKGVVDFVCEAQGGTFQGDGTACADVDCTPTGACCEIDGTCSEGTQED
ncbi:MAG: hypothetical protein V3U29_05375, partial [Phycisphaeraceae bacterium]